MALTVQATGTQTATVATEHTLHTSTVSGVHALRVDTSNMVDGDEIELRGYVKTLTGDTNPKLAVYAPYIHLQGDAAAPGSSGAGEVVKDSPPVTSPYSITWTLKQVAGTSRNFNWIAVTF